MGDAMVQHLATTGTVACIAELHTEDKGA
jgi:hypothetical protein